MYLTAVITKGEEFFIGQIKELQGVVTQGVSIEETKENLLDALSLWLAEAVVYFSVVKCKNLAYINEYVKSKIR